MSHSLLYEGGIGKKEENVDVVPHNIVHFVCCAFTPNHKTNLSVDTVFESEFTPHMDMFGFGL